MKTLKSYCRYAVLSALILSGSFVLNDSPEAQPAYPLHIAFEIKAERIRFINNSLKITWKMNKKYHGDFIVGRSEKEIITPENALQSKLVGIFSPELEGILIDRDIQQGKKYYYIVLAKDYLLKRNIDIIKNVNYTAEPVSIYIEPESVKSISAENSGDKKIELSWKKSKGDDLKYNLYRSRSPISSPAELEVSEKIITTDDDEFIDTRVEEYGSYYYAVTITDKSGVEYYKPKPGENFTTNGIFIKGKTLTTPLNVGAFSGEKDNIIIKWEKSESPSGKILQGYEIYRSEEIINSLLKLKFSKLIHITDKDKTLYTDKNLLPGKYFYAVFSRYNDGTVDVNFETDSNFTKTPVIISAPYQINAVYYEITNKRILLKWDFIGNSGDENITITKSLKKPSDSENLKKEDIIGTETIKAKRFIIPDPPAAPHYYCIITKNGNKVLKFKPGINMTSDPVSIDSEKPAKKKKKSPGNKQSDNTESGQYSGLDEIINNTYYKGRYPLALKELKKFIVSSDNKYEQSKARLFLARTYIEMHDYKEGIKLLDNADVKETFPDDVKFWQEFALVRLK